MKQLYLLLLTSFVLASCGSDHFKIDGKLAGVDGSAMRVVFLTDSGIVDEWVDVDKQGNFSYQGSASKPVIVSLLSQRGNLMVMLAATDGDHLKLKGDAGKPLGIKVSGNRLNEEWQLFRDEHAGFYTDANPSRLDAAIEKFVKEHPDDILSTVLLVADYSNFADRDKIAAMLDAIKSEARPESLVGALQDGTRDRHKRANAPRLMSLNLIKHGNSRFDEVKLTDRSTLVMLWANPFHNREALADKIRVLLDNGDNDVRVIDVLAEADTLRWHQTIAGESWPHYWAPGGPLEQGLQPLKITSMPWYAVTDSTGVVTYSGPDLDVAISKVKKPH